MKRLLTFLAATLLLVGLAGCDNFNRTPEERQILRRQNQMERAAGAMARLIYFQDTRPNPPICYAYFWEGNSQGGPAITAVDCAQVEHLLVGRVAAPGD